MNHDHSQHDPQPRRFWGSRCSIGLIFAFSFFKPQTAREMPLQP